MTYMKNAAEEFGKKLFIEVATAEYGWIAKTKYLKSNDAYRKTRAAKFCPVSTPEAVDIFLNDIVTPFPNHPSFKMPVDYLECLAEDLKNGSLRKELIIGYLTLDTKEPLIYRNNGHNPVFESKERTSRIKGELQRWGADRRGIDPRLVTVTAPLADAYCEMFRIPELREYLQARREV